MEMSKPRTQDYRSNSYNKHSYNSLKLQEPQISAPNFMTKQLEGTSDQDMAQDASQYVSKMDENRNKRAKIEKFLNEKKMANLQD